MKGITKESLINIVFGKRAVKEWELENFSDDRALTCYSLQKPLDLDSSNLATSFWAQDRELVFLPIRNFKLLQFELNE